MAGSAVVRRLRAAAVAALLVLSACTGGGDGDRGPSVRDSRNADLDALVVAIEAGHPSPFAELNEPSWRDDVAAARGRDMNADEFLVTVARLANLGARNGHTGVFPTDQAMPMWGVRLHDFSDGWYVVASTDSSLVGARVDAIGGRSIAAVADWLGPAVPRDNAATLRARLATYLASPSFVFGSGNPRGPWTVVDSSRRRRDVEPPLVTPAEYAALTGMDVPQIPLALPGPAWAPKEPWWFVRRGEALMIGWERVVSATDDGRTVRNFADRVRADVARQRPDRVVLDARRNPGGEVSAALPVTNLVRDLVRQRIPVRVLISRATYSATCVALAELRRLPGVTFFGEATGGGSFAYGNPAQTTLPRSGIVVHVAGGAAGTRGLDTIEPHEAVGDTWREWSRGGDDVAEAALAT